MKSSEPNVLIRFSSSLSRALIILSINKLCIAFLASPIARVGPFDNRSASFLTFEMKISSGKTSFIKPIFLAS